MIFNQISAIVLLVMLAPFAILGAKELILFWRTVIIRPVQAWFSERQLDRQHQVIRALEDTRLKTYEFSFKEGYSSSVPIVFTLAAPNAFIASAEAQTRVMCLKLTNPRCVSQRVLGYAKAD